MSRNSLSRESCRQLSSKLRGSWLLWTSAGLLVLALLAVLESKLNRGVHLDAVGANISSIDISEAKSNFGSYEVSWGMLSGRIANSATHLDLFLQAPRFSRVSWQLQGKIFDRWVSVEGEIPKTSRDDRSDLVVEIDAECGRARAFWIKRYQGPINDRRFTNSPPDCRVYRDVPWSGQNWGDVGK